MSSRPPIASTSTTTPERVRRLCAEHAVAAEDAWPDQAKLIRFEASKKRKHLAVRELFSAAST